MKECIVSFSSSGREMYNKAILRLIRTFKETGYDGDFLLRSTDSYVDEYLGVKILLGSLPITEKYGKSYNMEEVNYGFKLFLIWEAYELGFPLKNWVSDFALERSGVSEMHLENMNQVMCCAVFFDFDHPSTIDIFEEWMKMCLDGVSFNMKNGSVRPGFLGHRGDQPCLSLILGKRNIPLLPYGTLCYEPHDVTKEYGEPILVNRGII